MTSPLVSILSSYSAPGAKGSLVVGSGEFKANDGCTFKTIIDLAGSPDLVKAQRSVMSNRASPRGNPKLGPEAWCDIGILLSADTLPPDLADVISQAVFHIARLVKASLHQPLDPLLRGRPHNRGKAYIPLRRDFVVRRQTGDVDEALGLADRSFVEGCDAGCERLDKRVEVGIRE